MARDRVDGYCHKVGGKLPGEEDAQDIGKGGGAHLEFMRKISQPTQSSSSFQTDKSCLPDDPLLDVSAAAPSVWPSESHMVTFCYRTAISGNN